MNCKCAQPLPYDNGQCSKCGGIVPDSALQKSDTTGEVICEVKMLDEGCGYCPGPEEYVITEEHTISDIIRFAIKMGDKEDVLYLAKELCKCDI